MFFGIFHFQSPGGSTMPGSQQSYSQQTVQKSYSTQSPVTEGVQGQSHGVQTQQYAQHSVQYGTQGSTQGGTQQGYSVQQGVQGGTQGGTQQGYSVQQGVQGGTQGGTQQGYSVQQGVQGGTHGMSMSPQPQIRGEFYITIIL